MYSILVSRFVANSIDPMGAQTTGKWCQSNGMTCRKKHAKRSVKVVPFADAFDWETAAKKLHSMLSSMQSAGAVQQNRPSSGTWLRCVCSLSFLVPLDETVLKPSWMFQSSLLVDAMLNISLLLL